MANTKIPSFKLSGVYKAPITAYINNIITTAEPVVRRNIPEDESVLLTDTKVEKATREGNKFVGRIYTDSNGGSKDYQEVIHYGNIDGRTKTYTKSNGRVITTGGDGTQYMTKGSRYIQDNF